MLTPKDITQMIDLSAVRSESDDEAIATLVATAEKYHCGLVSVLPTQTALAKKLLEATPGIRLGGNVGFPSGGQTSAIKVAETRELVALGCDELDMVADLASMRSGRVNDTLNDIRAVVEAEIGRAHV